MVSVVTFPVCLCLPAITLTCPAVTITRSGSVSLSFVHRYSFESGSWDGGQVRISKNGGPFTTVSGSAFSANGYNGTVLPNSAAEIHGEPAFVETSAGHQTPAYLTSVADLGVFAAGDTLTLQFLAANDTNTRNLRPQWEITSLALTEGAGGAAGGAYLRAQAVAAWPLPTGGGDPTLPGRRAGRPECQGAGDRCRSAYRPAGGHRPPVRRVWPLQLPGLARARGADAVVHRHLAGDAIRRRPPRAAPRSATSPPPSMPPPRCSGARAGCSRRPPSRCC